MKMTAKWISISMVIVLMIGLFGCAENTDMAAGQNGQLIPVNDGGQDNSMENVIGAISDVQETMLSEECDVIPDYEEECTSSEELYTDEDYVPQMSLEDALSRMEYAQMDHFLVFEPEEGAALFYYASSQENAKDFTGTWKRTDVKTIWSATVQISNQDAEGFDVDGNFRVQSQKAYLEGRAYFVTENLAILRVYNKNAKPDAGSGETDYYEYVAFERTEAGMDIYATARGDDLFGMLVNYCFAEGNYVQGEPFYTDSNILHDTYTDACLEEIEILVGDELYEDCFVKTTENGSIHIYDIVSEDGTYGKKYHGYSIGGETNLFYKIYIFENGDIYGIIGKDRIFFTNVEGAAEVPDYDSVEE